MGYWLASAYEDLQEWDKAEALFLSKINQGDGDPWNYMRTGEIIYKQGGRDVEALSYLRKACTADNDYNEEKELARWMSARIWRWHADKEYQKIVDAVTEFEGNLDGADAYYYIDSLIKLDRKTEAEEAAYALEAEAHGEDTSWYEAVIRCWSLFGHTGHALRVACTLEAEARWEDASWCLAIVRLWHELSYFSHTLSLALKAKKLFPEEAEISVYLIDSLIQLDRKAEAEEAAHALETEARWDDWFWCLCVAQAWSLLHCPANVVKIAKKAKKFFPNNSEVFDGYMNCPIGYLTMHDSDKVRAG